MERYNVLKLLNIALILSFGLCLFGCASSDQVIKRKYYQPWEKEIGYSQVVQVNNTLYISGITSQKPTIEGQINEIYGTIKNILADYNAGTDDIVKEVIFASELEQLQAAIPIRKAHFSNHYPASSWVEVKSLWNKICLLEVEVIVELPQM